MDLTLLRTDASHPDFERLVHLLDAELAERDGREHAFYSAFNRTGPSHSVVLAYKGLQPAGCGAFHRFDAESAEIKRMFTLPEYRGRGVATRVLGELERWIRELAFRRCLLETGMRQPEAQALYRRCGYAVIPNYGPYAGVENSVCFSKEPVPSAGRR
jgi:GNAT superfamily N-acetyltransferase